MKGYLTGSWTRVLTTAASTAGNVSYNLYDNKYRIIRSYTGNHLGGYTQLDSQLSFTGTPVKTVTYQKQNSSATVLTITDNFTYDRRDRLTKQTRQIGTGIIETIVAHTYDELAVLVAKNVGGATGNLQTVDYKYNIRGWLTDINNANKDAIGASIKLYNQKIHYNASPASDPLYNGNISSVYTCTKTDNQLRGYSYRYDALNRLTNAYSLYYTGYPIHLDGFGNFNDYREIISYDKNGNILTMNRTGELVSGQPLQIDDLTYTYTGNQLQTVTDATNNNDGFKDVNKVGDDYAYDTFGNITQDLNKGINAVSYNHLNLPYQVTFANGSNIKYTYDAAGTRLSKKVQPNGGALVTTDYLNGFQYTDNVLKFFPHPEGYVEFKNNQYLYTYQYKDHLGNIRLTYRDGYRNHPTLEYAKDGVIQVTEIIEENNYYPFGLKYTGYNDLADYSATNKYKYAYGGKELNDELGLDLYDFGARNYDAAIGRWLNVDPLAEQYFNINPYGYALNNPVYFIDPDGMQVLDPDDIVKRQKEKLSSDLKSIRGMIKDGNIDAETGNKFISFIKGVQNEIKDLEDSKQVYNVFSDQTNKSNTGVVTYNFNTNSVDIAMGTKASFAVIGHELKHASQFEEGEVSWNRNGTSTLYDIGDETVGYNRQIDLDGGITQFTLGAQKYYTNKDIIDFGKKQNPQVYQNLNQSSLSLSSKEGKAMVKATIEAGKNGTTVPEVYIGWEKDYNKGVKKRK